MAYKYREMVLDELLRHGVIPRDDTPPELIHQFINDLYVYEIRVLRGRLKEGAVAMRDYTTQVEALRIRYPVLSLPVRFWLEAD
jgi:hypothetical protein